MQRIRLLLLDDHALFRDSVGRLLESEPDFEVVARCATTEDGLRGIKEKPVDMVLLDYDLGDTHGNAFLAQLRESGYQGKVLVVTAGMTEGEVSVALERGASGVFLKHDSPVTLAQAIRLVMAGGSWLDHKLLQNLASKAGHRESQAHRKPLTQREQQVLEAIFEGLTNKEIAVRLGASESGIKATLQQLFEKMQVRTRSQLVRVALEGSYLDR